MAKRTLPLSELLTKLFNDLGGSKPPIPRDVRSMVLEFSHSAEALESSEPLTEAKCRIVELEMQNKTLEARLQDSETQNKTLETKAQEYELLADKTRETLRIMQEEAKTKERTDGGLKAENDRLRQQVNAVVMEREQFRADSEKIFVSMEDEKRDNTKRIEELTEELKDSKAHVERLELETGNFRQEVGKLKADIAQFWEPPERYEEDSSEDKKRDWPEEAIRILLEIAGRLDAIHTVEHMAFNLGFKEGLVQHYLDEMGDAEMVCYWRGDDGSVYWKSTRKGLAFLVTRGLLS